MACLTRNRFHTFIRNGERHVSPRNFKFRTQNDTSSSFGPKQKRTCVVPFVYLIICYYCCVLCFSFAHWNLQWIIFWLVFSSFDSRGRVHTTFLFHWVFNAMASNFLSKSNLRKCKLCFGARTSVHNFSIHSTQFSFLHLSAPHSHPLISIEIVNLYANIFYFPFFLFLPVMTDNAFKARDIGLRAQKKILSRMATKTVAKTFIDGTTASLLDNIYRLAKLHVSFIIISSLFWFAERLEIWSATELEWKRIFFCLLSFTTSNTRL